MTLQPTRSTYAPGEAVTVRVDAVPAGSTLSVRGVGGVAGEVAVDGADVSLG